MYTSTAVYVSILSSSLCKDSASRRQSKTKYEVFVYALLRRRLSSRRSRRVVQAEDKAKQNTKFLFMLCWGAAYLRDRAAESCKPKAKQNKIRSFCLCFVEAPPIFAAKPQSRASRRQSNANLFFILSNPILSPAQRGKDDNVCKWQQVFYKWKGDGVNQNLAICVCFTLKNAYFCQETRKSCVFAEKIPLKIWLVG